MTKFVAALPHTIASLPHLDQDQAHPATHPLFVLATVLAVLGAEPGKTPTPKDVARELKALEQKATGAGEDSYQQSLVTQTLWREIHNRLLLQVAGAIVNAQETSYWLKLAALANAELDRCAKRVKSSKPSARLGYRTNWGYPEPEEQEYSLRD